MSAVDIFGLLIPATWVVMLIWERLFPARALPPVRWWTVIGFVFLVAMGLISALTPLLIPPAWLASHRIFDLSGLGPVWGAVVGYTFVSLLSFLWHRSAHAFSPMWRLTHQIHHAPARMDMAGSQLFHPTEMIAFTLIGLFVTVILLGLDPVAAAATGYIAAFYGMFQHWNVRTPQWLGYLIQRPESHSWHHEKGVHARNYADLPIWDILTGGFYNPKDFAPETGFDAPADHKYFAMLAFADVNAATAGPGSIGQTRKA